MTTHLRAADLVLTFTSATMSASALFNGSFPITPFPFQQGFLDENKSAVGGLREDRGKHEISDTSTKDSEAFGKQTAAGTLGTRATFYFLRFDTVLAIPHKSAALPFLRRRFGFYS